MTYELLEIEKQILRDEEFISQDISELSSDQKIARGFQAIGDVLKQQSFIFHQFAK